MKRLLSLILIATYLTVGLTVPPAQASPALPILSAKSAIILNPVTGKILFSKRAYRERPPASTTKLITALVVMDHLPMNRVITVPRSAEAVPPSGIRLRRGERFYVRDLLKAMLIRSANDAAHTLAIAVAGSEARFVKLMNRKARAIGAKHTRFANPHGLPRPTNQFTTVYDLALIMKQARKNKFILQQISKRGEQIHAVSGRNVYLKSTNKMLLRKRTDIQGKTGFTRSALYCFVGKIRTKRHGDLLVAIMGSLKPWQDLATLAAWGKRLMWDPIQLNRTNLAPKQVARIQQALKRAGHSPGTADGVFGTKTLKAVKSFQKAKGLKVDGLVGSRTLSKLSPYMR